MKALITCVIPTFQRPQFLKRSVNSVLKQTFSDFEILIADNASGEETDGVIREFMKQDHRVKGIKHATNIGAVANFQAALMQVNTPYVCFLPDDDFFAPFFFAETAPLVEKHPDVAFCGGGGVNIDAEYRVSTITRNHPFIPASGYYHPPSGLFAYLNSSFAIAFPPLLFKTSVLKELGGFDLRIRNGADEHLISQCAANYPVYLKTDRPFYFGFQHEGSLSRQINYSLFSNEATYLHENISKIPLSTSEKEAIDQFFYKRKSKIFSSAYSYFCARHEFGDACTYAKYAEDLTSSRSWKRKYWQAKLFQYTPFLASLYERGKTMEKRLRKGKISTSIPTISEIETHPEATFLQEYARALDTI